MIQHYLDQLIADMHQAAQRVPTSKIPEGTFDPDYQDELEASPDRLMSEWFGLEKEFFPPSEMLTTEELDLMANEFELMWAAYSFFPEFPEGLPAKRCIQFSIFQSPLFRQKFPVTFGHVLLL
jgi:hypothetical protein